MIFKDWFWIIAARHHLYLCLVGRLMMSPDDLITNSHQAL